MLPSSSYTSSSSLQRQGGGKAVRAEPLLNSARGVLSGSARPEAPPSYALSLRSAWEAVAEEPTDTPPLSHPSHPSGSGHPQANRPAPGLADQTAGGAQPRSRSPARLHTRAGARWRAHTSGEEGGRHPGVKQDNKKHVARGETLDPPPPNVSPGGIGCAALNPLQVFLSSCPGHVWGGGRER